MPGVRIRPVASRRTVDSAMVVVTDRARPINTKGTQLPRCNVCRIPHPFKSYHLQLVDGHVIVSEGVWEQLQLLVDNGGFEFVNEVASPPTQTLTPGKTIEFGNQVDAFESPRRT